MFASGLAPPGSRAPLVQGSPGVQDLQDYFKGDSFALHITRRGGVCIILVPPEPPKSHTAIVRNARAVLKVDDPQLQNPMRSVTLVPWLSSYIPHFFSPQKSQSEGRSRRDKQSTQQHSPQHPRMAGGLPFAIPLGADASWKHLIPTRPFFSWATRKCFSCESTCQTQYL